MSKHASSLTLLVIITIDYAYVIRLEHRAYIAPDGALLYDPQLRSPDRVARSMTSHTLTSGLPAIDAGHLILMNLVRLELTDPWT